jgi:anti-sigma factor RsiW
MSCQETETLIHGYLDNELDLAHSLEVEQHLGECAACGRAWQEQLDLRHALRSMAPYYTAPESLRGRMQKPPSQRRYGWFAAAAVAAMVVVSVGIWNVPRAGQEQELVADHVRSLMANHLTDVNSTDQHTVKPWFSGKLDFSPVAKDFADHDFRLIGGRLDYLGGRTVAVLVYQRRQHLINAFTWPSTDTRSEKTMTKQGYNIVSWARSGMAFSLVSDLNAKELEELAKLLQ